MTSKLGTVVHMVTSNEGACTFPATDAWQATELAPGGYESAVEAIPESMFKKFRGAFKRGAVFRSFLEQTGDCIFGGKLTDDPFNNDGRVDLAIAGNAKELEAKSQRLAYLINGYDEWMDSRAEATGNSGFLSTEKWDVNVDGGLHFKRNAETFQQVGAGPGLSLRAPDQELTRMTFTIAGLPSAGNTAKLSIYSGESSFDQLVAEITIDNTTATSQDIDLTEDTLNNKIATGPWVDIQINDLATNYTSALKVSLTYVQVYALATSDEMSVSAVARDLAARAGIADLGIAEFGYNAMPLDFKNGETFAECFAYLGLLANARALVLDTGTRPYIEFDRFSKRVWTPDKHQRVDTLPLPRYDRASFPWLNSNGRTVEWTKVIAETPLDPPRSYGRIRTNNPVGWGEPSENLAGRIVEQLVKQRLGGDFELSHVTDEDGLVRSAYLLHAGDILRDPERGGRGRIARKSMTIRGVTGELESNYAPLDRLLEHEAKRMQRAS